MCTRGGRPSACLPFLPCPHRVVFSQAGGALAMADMAMVVIQDSLFDGNRAVLYGGAMFAGPSLNLTRRGNCPRTEASDRGNEVSVRDTRFLNNIASYDGGAAFFTVIRAPPSFLPLPCLAPHPCPNSPSLLAPCCLQPSAHPDTTCSFL